LGRRVGGVGLIFSKIFGTIFFDKGSWGI